jgi:hypothetical protein
LVGDGSGLGICSLGFEIVYLSIDIGAFLVYGDSACDSSPSINPINAINRIRSINLMSHLGHRMNLMISHLSFLIPSKIGMSSKSSLCPSMTINTFYTGLHI